MGNIAYGYMGIMEENGNYYNGYIYRVTPQVQG